LLGIASACAACGSSLHVLRASHHPGRLLKPVHPGIETNPASMLQKIKQFKALALYW
jgi:hypothetical protein